MSNAVRCQMSGKTAERTTDEMASQIPGCWRQIARRNSFPARPRRTDELVGDVGQLDERRDRKKSSCRLRC